MVNKKAFGWMGLLLAFGLLLGCNSEKKLSEKMKATEEARQRILVAVKAFHESQGAYPADLGVVLPELPGEAFTQKNRVVPEYDGKGGWMYNVETGEVYVNFQP
jgi:hypothetical protein